MKVVKDVEVVKKIDWFENQELFTSSTGFTIFMSSVGL